MNLPAFFDMEVSERGDRILDIGCIGSDGSTFHKNQVTAFLEFTAAAEFICGHNIFAHDLVHLQKHSGNSQWGINRAIDTLLLSPLLFPEKPYHRLLKDDKLQTEVCNNPLNDASKVFVDFMTASRKLSLNLFKTKKTSIKNLYLKTFMNYAAVKSNSGTVILLKLSLKKTL